MAFTLSEKAQLATQGTEIKPLIVLEIEGVDNVFGTTAIQENIEIGSTDLKIGTAIPGESSVWVIGGLRRVEDQFESRISLQAGTTTQIRQKVNQDRGTGESIPSMQIAVVDKNLEATNLISPGNVVTDIIGRRCKAWLGFENTSFKDDFIVIFRGVVDETLAGAGIVTFNIVHPDRKKKSKLFVKATTTLSSGIDASVTTIPVVDDSNFLAPVTGPDGTIDESIKFYVRIDDEVIRYTGKTGTSFTSATRGSFGTAASHSSGANVESYIGLDGHPIDLALKLMLGGKEGAYRTGVDVTNFVRTSGSQTVANAIFFQDVDISTEFNVRIGDFVTTTGASNGANNVTLEEITDIVETTDGSYLVIDPTTALVEENDSAAVIDFRSQYDTFPSGAGVGMNADEVDIAQHESARSTFYASTSDLEFSIFDTVDNVKQFISEQLYNPVGAFSLPRKSQASLGVHAPPLPGTETRTLDTASVTNASRLKICRSIGKNFFNFVSYNFDEDRLTEDKFNSILATTDATSLAQIEVPPTGLTIKSKGLRGSAGESEATTATSRRLNKYKFAAEFIRGMDVNFKTSFDLEIGDIIVLDLNSLNISDIKSGTRDGETRLFEIDNKTLNIKTGKISLDITDTNFDQSARFGSMAPSSTIKSGVSTSSFVIEESFSAIFGQNEFRKWQDFVGAFVNIHNGDYSTSGTSTISSVSGNTITLTTALAFTPTAGMTMDFGDYDSQPDNVKILYAFMRDSAFADGKPQYQQF